MDQSQAVDLKAAFDRDGFVILRDFVPSAQLHEICRRAEAATGKQTRTSGPFTNVTKGLEKLDDYFGEFLNIFGVGVKQLRGAAESGRESGRREQTARARWREQAARAARADCESGLRERTASTRASGPLRDAYEALRV